MQKADFSKIEEYLSLTNQLNSTESFTMLEIDQMVPHSLEEVFFQKSSPLSETVLIKDNVFSNAELPPMGVDSQIPVPVLDQQIEGSESPKTLTDLDHSDQVFYEEINMPIKKEYCVEEQNCFISHDNVFRSSPMSQPHFHQHHRCDQHQQQHQQQHNHHLNQNVFFNETGGSLFQTDESLNSQNVFLTNGNIEISCKEESSQAIFTQLSALVQCHIKQEIDGVCKKLRILPDPCQWSVDDVRKWIAWQARDYCPQMNLNLLHFNMNGQHLSCMTEDDFKYRVPEGGAKLYAQLDVWKNACNLPSVPAVQLSELFENTERSVSPSLSTSSEESHVDKPPCQQYLPVFDSDGESYPSSPEPVNGRKSCEHKQTIHLWQFLKELLLKPNQYGNYIKWLDRNNGIFKIEDSAKVAKLWGIRKNRPAMNYDKLSRSIRQYYKKGIIKKTTHSKRLVYQFCPNYL